MSRTSGLIVCILFCATLVFLYQWEKKQTNPIFAVQDAVKVLANKFGIFNQNVSDFSNSFNLNLSEESTQSRAADGFVLEVRSSTPPAEMSNFDKKMMNLSKPTIKYDSNTTSASFTSLRKAVHNETSRGYTTTPEPGPKLVRQPNNLNVLMILTDDLRPEIGAFLDSKSRPWLNADIKTPNLDKLAERSLVLRRAFVQVARCNPSRVSMLTSRRPNTTKIFNNDRWFREIGNGKNIMTLPQYFKKNHYNTIGAGKIFHLLGRPGTQDQGMSWTGSFFKPSGHFDKLVDESWRAVTKEERRNRPLKDELVVRHAKLQMKYAAAKFEESGQPFFMAVGLKKPHTPYVFPSEFLDWYPRDKVPLPQNPYVPVGMPRMHWHSSHNALSFDGTSKFSGTWGMNSSLPDETAIDLRRGYYACVSYIDELVGQLLDEIDKYSLRNRTIVVFGSDHGYQLGEHGIWGKDTNFELATNSPMIVSIPALTDTRIDSFRLTEYVDLFPTLVDAAGLPPLPVCPVNSDQVSVCTEGASMLPLIKDMGQPWKDRVFSEYPSPDSGQPRYIGHSVRNDEFLYIEWTSYENTTADYWPKPKHREIYDLVKDINQNTNYINDPNYTEQIGKMSRLLRAGWRAAMPQNA